MARLTERISFSMPVEAKERLRRRAKSLGVSMSDLIRYAADEMMQEELDKKANQ